MTWCSGALVYAYTGREYDPESGLYFYRARYYDSKVGRFLEQDPIGFLGGMNFYVYCLNNPVNFVDPWGLTRLTWTYNGHIAVSPAPVAFGVARRRTSRPVTGFLDALKVIPKKPIKTRTIPEVKMFSYVDLGFTLGGTDLSGKGDTEHTTDYKIPFTDWGFIVGYTDDWTFNSFEISFGVGLNISGFTKELKAQKCEDK